jgi:hypothetical protein
VGHCLSKNSGLPIRQTQALPDMIFESEIITAAEIMHNKAARERRING